MGRSEVQKHIFCLLLTDKVASDQVGFLLEEGLQAAQRCIEMTHFQPGTLDSSGDAPHPCARGL